MTRINELDNKEPKLPRMRDITDPVTIAALEELNVKLRIFLEKIKKENREFEKEKLKNASTRDI